MAEWNAYYRNEDEEEGQDEGEEAAGETRAAVAPPTFVWLLQDFVAYLWGNENIFLFPNQKVYLKADKWLLNGKSVLLCITHL